MFDFKLFEILIINGFSGKVNIAVDEIWQQESTLFGVRDNN